MPGHSPSRRHLLQLLGVGLLGSSVGCTRLRNAPAVQSAKLTATDGNDSDKFGHAVALGDEGRTALISAWGDTNPNGENAGAVYVFEQSEDGWTQRAKLLAADGDGDDHFGDAVALSSIGTTALIGASYNTNPNGEDAGAAYVFERGEGGWIQQAKLLAADGDDGDRFGWSVALGSEGGIALIGAPDATSPDGESRGAAYVFERGDDGWAQQTRLLTVDGGLSGGAVALGGAGRTALISAFDDTTSNGEAAGAAYVFQRDEREWHLQAKLSTDDTEPGDRFGWSVALARDGRTALVGAYSVPAPHEEGAAYVFERDEDRWIQRAKLLDTANSGDKNDAFGWSVALGDDGKTALIGASREDNPNIVGNWPGTGAAHAFERGEEGWTQQAKFFADDAGGGDSFGWSVALARDGGTALIGASEYDKTDLIVRGPDDIKSSMGSAYVFSVGGRRLLPISY